MKSSMVLKALAILISMGSPGIAQVDQWTRFDRLNDGAITCMTAAPNGDIYISTNQSGVHRSTDLGVTWQAVNNGINGTDVRVVAVL
jgi:hypothetical protein